MFTRAFDREPLENMNTWGRLTPLSGAVYGCRRPPSHDRDAIDPARNAEAIVRGRQSDSGVDGSDPTGPQFDLRGFKDDPRPTLAGRNRGIGGIRYQESTNWCWNQAEAEQVRFCLVSKTNGRKGRNGIQTTNESVFALRCPHARGGSVWRRHRRYHN